jgi:hypothetical protein
MRAVHHQRSLPIQGKDRVSAAINRAPHHEKIRGAGSAERVVVNLEEGEAYR